MTQDTLNNNAPRARAIRMLKQWISEGTLAPGTPLPPERVLCKRLNVGRETCRRALMVLEKEGWTSTVGPRTRMVEAQDLSMQTGIMSRTVVVIAGSRQPESTHRQGGWSDHISWGVFSALQDLQHHALHLCPERMDQQQLAQLITDRPAGVIIPMEFGSVHPLVGWLKQVRRAGIPVVVYGDDSHLTEYDRVISDHEIGAYQLTRWLLDQGWHRPACIWGNSPDCYWVRARYAGYCRALEEARLTPLPTIHLAELPAVEPARSRFEMKSRLMAGYLAPLLTGEPAVDALLAVSDGEVPQVAAACRILGKVPNRDVAIVGYDSYWNDVSERQWETTAPLASVDKQNFKLGQELAKLLVGRLERRLPDPPQRRVLAPTLVISATASSQCASDLYPG